MRTRISLVGASVAVLAALASAPLAAVSCFPTCAPDDSRFVSLAGGGPLSSLSGIPLRVRLLPAPGAASIEVSIFDGDSGATDAAGAYHWDLGSTSTYYTVLPCADRECLVFGPPAAELVSTQMPDNAWFTFHLPAGPAAYQLVAELDPTRLHVTTLNQIKLRTDGDIVLGENEQPFAFVAEWTNLADIQIAYPHFDAWDWFDFDNNLADARYDGTFTFVHEVELPAIDRGPYALEIWNGDLDRGKFDGSDQDSDDPDTPSGVSVSAPCPWELLPPFYRRPEIPDYARSRVCSEGVAVGFGGTSGAPADENDPSVGSGLNRYVCRPPSIYFEVSGPDGSMWTDANPSGNREWERFCIVEAAGIGAGAEPDVRVEDLLAGLYVVRLKGMDHNNLNAWACRCVGAGAENGCSCTIHGSPPGGCTPGFWKQPQHAHHWVIFSPGDLFEDVFGVSAAGSPTLLDALRAKGGGEGALQRHATASLLNAAAQGVDFVYAMAEIVDLVRQAYATGEFEPVKDRFAEQNEIGCSLDGGVKKPTKKPKGLKLAKAH